MSKEKRNNYIEWVFGTACIILALALGYWYSTREALSEPRRDTITVAAVGDSITNGVGVSELTRSKYSYPSQLQELLGGKYVVLNFGVNGTTLLSTGRNPYIKQSAFTASRSADADIVLIMLGTNDSAMDDFNATQYEKELTTFVEGYKNLSSEPEVYVLTPPTSYFGTESIMTSKIIPAIKAVVTKTETQLIDIHAATNNRSELFPDGIHPDGLGYRIIAETVDRRITHRDM